jgi:hypothetical protein
MTSYAPVDAPVRFEASLLEINARRGNPLEFEKEDDLVTMHLKENLERQGCMCLLMMSVDVVGWDNNKEKPKIADLSHSVMYDVLLIRGMLYESQEGELTVLGAEEFLKEPVADVLDARALSIINEEMAMTDFDVPYRRLGGCVPLLAVEQLYKAALRLPKHQL